jgi:peptidoglycan/LPS O-acetylase OafA/YrhL
MEQTTQQKQPNVLLQYGMIAALAYLLVFVVMYLVGTSAFTNYGLSFLTMLIPVVFAVLACRKQKTFNGGYLSFKEALRLSFGILVLASLVTTLFSYVLFNFIDKPFAESLKQVTVEKTQEFMSKMGTPQDATDKAVRDIMEKDFFSLGTLIQNFMTVCILNFIIALIIAAIVKKKKPEFSS